MKRFNYLPSREPRWLRGVLRWFHDIEISPRTQGAFLVCGCTAVLCALLSLWENTELQITQVAYDRMQVRLTQRDGDVHQLRTITNTIERLDMVAHEVAQVRGEIAQRLSRIAELGNHFRALTWLLTIHEENNTIHLRGRARSAAEIGFLMTDIEHVRGIGNPQLREARAINSASSNIVEFDLSLEEKANV